MTRYARNVVEGKSPPFPAGVFIGALKEAKEEWYAEDQKQPDTKKGLRVNLTFKEITPIEGPQVGSRQAMQRVDVIRNGQSIVEIQEFNDTVPFQLRQSATLVLQLALALGAAGLTAEGEVDLDMGPFLEALTQGVFADHAVIFEVEQRTYDSKNVKNADGTARKVTASNIVAFKGANGNAETASIVTQAPTQGTANPPVSEVNTLRTR